MKEYDFDKIEAYLNGQLSEEENAILDKQIEEDEAFAAVVDQYGIANDALEILIGDNLRAEMKKWDTAAVVESTATEEGKVVSINKKRSVKKISLFRRLSIAASIALLVGLFSWQFSSNYSNDALLSEIYQDYDFSALRSTANQRHPLEEGVEALQAQKNQNAIQFFENINSDNPFYTQAQFYLGHSFYKNKDYVKAINAFQQVIDRKDIRYAESAEWYQISSYLAADNTSNDFMQLLGKIASDEGHTYQTQARQLNDKMNSFWRKLQ